MISASDIIESKLNGISFDCILKAVKSGSSSVNDLPEEQVSLMEELFSNVKDGIDKLDDAVKKGDLGSVTTAAEVIIESCTMIIDASKDSEGNNE